MDPSQLFGAWLDDNTFLGGCLEISLDRFATTVQIEAYEVRTDKEDGCACRGGLCQKCFCLPHKSGSTLKGKNLPTWEQFFFLLNCTSKGSCCTLLQPGSCKIFLPFRNDVKTTPQPLDDTVVGVQSRNRVS